MREIANAVFMLLIHVNRMDARERIDQSWPPKPNPEMQKYCENDSQKWWPVVKRCVCLPAPGGKKVRRLQ